MKKLSISHSHPQSLKYHDVFSLITDKLNPKKWYFDWSSSRRPQMEELKELLPLIFSVGGVDPARDGCLELNRYLIARLTHVSNYRVEPEIVQAALAFLTNSPSARRAVSKSKTGANGLVRDIDKDGRPRVKPTGPRRKRRTLSLSQAEDGALPDYFFDTIARRKMSRFDGSVIVSLSDPGDDAEDTLETLEVRVQSRVLHKMLASPVPSYTHLTVERTNSDAY